VPFSTRLVHLGLQMLPLGGGTRPREWIHRDIKTRSNVFLFCAIRRTGPLYQNPRIFGLVKNYRLARVRAPHRKCRVPPPLGGMYSSGRRDGPAPGRARTEPRQSARADNLCRGRAPFPLFAFSGTNLFPNVAIQTGEPLFGAPEP